MNSAKYRHFWETLFGGERLRPSKPPLSPILIGLVLAFCLLTSTASAQLAASNWPKFQGNNAGNGVTPVAGILPAIKWSSFNDQNSTNSPVTGPDGTIYLGDSFGRIYALSSNGNLKWTYYANGQIQGAIAVGKNGLIYANNLSNVVAIDPTTQTQVWISSGYGQFVDCPISIGSDGTVYVTDAFKGLLAYDGMTGALKWTSSVAFEGGYSPLSIGSDGTIYCPGGPVYAINPANGKVIWTQSTINTGSPIVIGPTGTLFVGVQNGTAALDPKDGSILWTSTDAWANGLGCIPVVSSKNVVYIPDAYHGAVFAVDGSNGDVIWSSPATAQYFSGTLLDGNGTVYAANSGGTVYAINSINGTPLWNHTFSGAFLTPFGIGNDGSVYVCASETNNGNINALANFNAATVNLSRTNLTGNTTTNGNIDLPAAVFSSVQVSLSSSDPSQVTVPATVTVPVGSSSASFAVTVKASNTAYTAKIMATCNGGSAVPITINVSAGGDPITTLSLSPYSLLGGQSSTGTITLTGDAPSSGWTVYLTSQIPSYVSVPASITVAAGKTSATFPITTKAFRQSYSNTITASDGLATKSATLSIVDDSISTVSLNPTSLNGAGTSTGTVTLLAAAPAGGLTVNLTSQIPSYVSVPASITIPAGSTSATFTATAKAFRDTYTNLITATDATSSKGATLTIVDDSIMSVTLNPSTVIAGSSTTGTITLYGAAPAGGWTVNLTSQLPSYVSVPATVTIPAGSSAATFTVATKDFRQTYTDLITVKDPLSSRNVTVTATNDSVESVTLSPASVVGGSNSTGTVTLYGPAPAGGWTVNLSSQIPSYVGVPATVTIPAGSSTASFTVTTKTFRQTYTDQIYAKDAGSSRVATLTVTTS